MGRNRVLHDDGLLGNLDARPFGLPDRLLLQVFSLMREPPKGAALFQNVNSWASHSKLLTLFTDVEDLRPGGFRMARKPPAFIYLRLQLAAYRLKDG